MDFRFESFLVSGSLVVYQEPSGMERCTYQSHEYIIRATNLVLIEHLVFAGCPPQPGRICALDENACGILALSTEDLE